MRKIAGGGFTLRQYRLSCLLSLLCRESQWNRIDVTFNSESCYFKVGHKDILFMGRNVCLPSCHNCSQKLWVLLPSLPLTPPYRVQDDLFMLSTSLSLLPLSQSLLLPAVGFAVSSVGCLLLLLLPLPPSLCTATPPSPTSFTWVFCQISLRLDRFLQNFCRNLV